MITDCSVNGYKGGNPSCNLTPGTCTPVVGNCSGLTSVYYYDITYFQINCATPLPVELINFEVKSVDNINCLSWTTISELNNDYFILERSLNVLDWEVIAIENGNDNSSTLIKYESKDCTFKKVKNYYRLKQVDFNGSILYSNIIYINNEKSNKKIIKITDILGNIVDENYAGVVLIYYSDNSIIKYVQ
jgi:hypothetical protein